MKQLKYILLVLGVAFLMQSCGGDDAIDQRLPSSEFFVTFDTKSGVENSLSVIEGQSVMVSITIGATKGAPVTVDFDVETPQTSNPASSAYKILGLDGIEMTSKTLTFPEGTGTQSFLFLAVDNEDLDGDRTFNLKLKSNSAGYRLGVNIQNQEGATMPIIVTDDEHVLKEFTGTWTVSSTRVEDFTVTAIGGPQDNVIILKNFPVGYGYGVYYDVPVIVDVENGTLEIASIKGIPSGYGTYMLGTVENGSVVAKSVYGVITEDRGFQFTGNFISYITEGGNAGAAFAQFINMKFSR